MKDGELSDYVRDYVAALRKLAKKRKEGEQLSPLENTLLRRYSKLYRLIRDETKRRCKGGTRLKMSWNDRMMAGRTGVVPG